MQKSLEDIAGAYLAGEPVIVTQCYCQEFAHMVVHQAAEIKQLKAKIKEMLACIFNGERKWMKNIRNQN